MRKYISMNKRNLFILLLIGVLVPVFVFAVTIENPLRGAGIHDIPTLILRITHLLRLLAQWIVPIVIIIAGFNFIFAGGDENKIKTSRNIITWAVIGLLVVICARGIMLLFATHFGTPVPDNGNGNDIVEIEATLVTILNTLYGFLLIVAGIAFVIAGYFFVSSAGDPEKYKKAQNFVLYAAVGVLVAIFARGIVALVQRITGVD